MHAVVRVNCSQAAATHNRSKRVCQLSDTLLHGSISRDPHCSRPLHSLCADTGQSTAAQTSVSALRCHDSVLAAVSASEPTTATGWLSCREAGSRLPSTKVLLNNNRFPRRADTLNPGRRLPNSPRVCQAGSATCAHGNAVSPPASGVFLRRATGSAWQLDGQRDADLPRPDA